MYGNADYPVRCRRLDNFPLWKIIEFLCRVEKYETTCILHASFSPILENYLSHGYKTLYLQCESPYFHGLWYFYLSSHTWYLWIHLYYYQGIRSIDENGFINLVHVPQKDGQTTTRTFIQQGRVVWKWARLGSRLLSHGFSTSPFNIGIFLSPQGTCFSHEGATS